jgi:lipopolysaccharide export system protein LptC
VNSGQNPTYQAGMDVRFAAAARHSRLVRLLRIAVPAAVILSMGMIVAVSIFNPFRMILNKLPIDMGNLVVSGTKITMESPHLAGFSPDGRPYELWAKTATQDVTDPTHVELGSLRAKVRMEDQSSVTMDARTGLFDTKAQLLELHKDIFLQSSTGYEARMTQALVDIAQGTVTSDEQVDVKLLNGTLVGQRLKIIDHGALVRFDGGVVMNLVMDQPDPSASAEAATEPAVVADPTPPPQKARPSSAKPGNAK